MRLPQRFRNRGVYGLALGVVALCYILVWGDGNLDFGDEFGAFFISAALSAGFGGLIFWPRHKRKVSRMLLTGALSVAFAFSVSVPLAFILNGLLPNEYPGFQGVTDAFENWWLALTVFIFGPILTLFIPYVLGLGLSVLFADD